MCRMFVLLFLSSYMLVSGQADGPVTVEQFRQGENVTISTPGDTQDGCKFVFQDPYTDTTCCYSARSRGETLCDPSIQGSGCRKDPAFRVVEEVVDDHRVTVGCGLRLLDVQPVDAGQYLVIFPARLEDNVRLQLEVEKDPSRAGSSIVVIGVITGLLFLIVIVVIGFKIYQRTKLPGEGRQDREDPDLEPVDFITRWWPSWATWDYWGGGSSRQARAEEVQMDRWQEDSLVGVRITEVVEKHAKETQLKHTKDMAALREEIKVLKSQHEEYIQVMDGKLNKLVKKHTKELEDLRSEMRSLKCEPALQVQVPVSKRR